LLDNNALHWACTNGYLEIVKYFIEICNIDPNLNDNLIIRWACRNGHYNIVEYLENIESIDCNLNMLNIFDIMPIEL
jgi:ankyrin repeat protein